MRADLDSANLAADVVATARRLSPQIVATREEAERLRHLPPALADVLADAGLYRLYLPRAVGGLELAPAIAFEVIEVLSKADGSVGWCLMNANAVALGGGRKLGDGCSGSRQTSGRRVHCGRKDARGQ
jgi:alkylation response protein AidB-like acyl-CoA dehydrogenase